MAKRKCKADRRLRKLKFTYQQQLRQLKEEFYEQLQGMEHRLVPLLQTQCFYHEALIHLLTSEGEPDSDTLIGAMLCQRWVRQSGQQLHKNLIDYQAQHRP